MLAQGKLNESAAQAEILRNQAGQQPEVAQFFVDLLHAQAKADPTPERTAAMDQAYAQLPETDDVQRRQKVQSGDQYRQLQRRHPFTARNHNDRLD